MNPEWKIVGFLYLDKEMHPIRAIPLKNLGEENEFLTPYMFFNKPLRAPKTFVFFKTPMTFLLFTFPLN